MYHSSADDADRRNTELVEGVEQLQELVARVTQEKEELSVQLVEETSRYVGRGRKETRVRREREEIRKREGLGKGERKERCLNNCAVALL